MSLNQALLLFFTCGGQRSLYEIVRVEEGKPGNEARKGSSLLQTQSASWHAWLAKYWWGEMLDSRS